MIFKHLCLWLLMMLGNAFCRPVPCFYETPTYIVNDDMVYRNPIITYFLDINKDHVSTRSSRNS